MKVTEVIDRAGSSDAILLTINLVDAKGRQYTASITAQGEGGYNVAVFVNRGSGWVGLGYQTKHRIERNGVLSAVLPVLYRHNYL